ncbi:MAG: AAA family ATPase, partial [Thermoprotei archaeon]
RRMPLAEDVDLAALADKTEGYSGADIAAVCREAALIALREAGRPAKVEMRHFDEALKLVAPSISEEDIGFYEGFMRQFKSRM